MGHDKRGCTRSTTGQWPLILALLLIFALPALNVSEAMAKTATMVITETTEDSFTSDKGVFLITEKTVVLDSNGAVFSNLNYIRLPCRAKVDYKASDSGTQVARKVKVIETLRRKNDRDPKLPQ